MNGKMAEKVHILRGLYAHTADTQQTCVEPTDILSEPIFKESKDVNDNPLPLYKYMHVCVLSFILQCENTDGKQSELNNVGSHTGSKLKMELINETFIHVFYCAYTVHCT